MTPLNILVAFPYFVARVLEFLKTRDHSHYRLMVDSGAFTAHASGKAIALDDYCKFLDSLEALRPFHAVQLDVIGNPEASLKNFETMKARGYDVLPVFTRGAPINLLDHLFTQSDYILIGGVAVGENRTGYVKWLIPKIKDRRVHLLGFTNLDFVRTIRPYSIDSSALTSGGRYGRLSLYQGFGKMAVFSKSDIIKMEATELYSKGLPSGLTHKQLHFLFNELAWSGGASELGPKATVRWLCAYAYVALACDIERNVGTRSYQALSTVQELEACFNAYDLYWKLNPNMRSDRARPHP